jgi:hypothetical protein
MLLKESSRPDCVLISAERPGAVRFALHIGSRVRTVAFIRRTAEPMKDNSRKALLKNRSDVTTCEAGTGFGTSLPNAFVKFGLAGRRAVRVANVRVALCAVQIWEERNWQNCCRAKELRYRRPTVCSGSSWRSHGKKCSRPARKPTCCPYMQDRSKPGRTTISMRGRHLCH